MNNNQSRINLLKEVKSAVNTASFAPTADRIEDAKKAVQGLMSYVESLEEGLKKKPQKKKVAVVVGRAYTLEELGALISTLTGDCALVCGVMLNR